MGLDMYLSAKEYVSRWDYSDGYDNRKETEKFAQIADGSPVARMFLSEDSNGMELTYTVMYWRKANAIHQWFVDNVQEGEDNCGEYYVSKENLKSLASVCGGVMLNNTDKDYIKEHLPPQSGFFFGSTEIDEWYFDDVRRTYEGLTDLVAKAEKLEEQGIYMTFSYHSSW